MSTEQKPALTRDTTTGLNPRQTAFVLAYVAGGNATQAAKDAGYADTRATETGSRLVRLPHVARAIEAGRVALAERANLDADRIVANIQAIHDRNAGGSTSAEAVALTAATTLARIAGLMVDRRETTTTGRVEVVMARQETQVVDGRAVLVDAPEPEPPALS